jgi:hypothetical protein
LLKQGFKLVNAPLSQSETQRGFPIFGHQGDTYLFDSALYRVQTIPRKSRSSGLRHCCNDQEQCEHCCCRIP